MYDHIPASEAPIGLRLGSVIGLARLRVTQADGRGRRADDYW